MQATDSGQARVRGRWARGTSGNPLGARINRVTERAGELFVAMAQDFGTLSAVDQALLNQACLLLARSERIRRARDADAAIRMSGEARRLLAQLQKRARPHDDLPSLAEYVSATYGSANDASDGRPHDETPDHETRASDDPNASPS